jgi:signal transduction histidine kinase
LARVRAQLSMAALRRRAVEQEALTASLVQQQRWLEAVLDRLPVATLLLDSATGEFPFANRAAQALSGGRFPVDLEGAHRGAFRVTDEDDRPIASEDTPIARARRGEHARQMEAVWHTPAGRFNLAVDSDEVPAQGSQPARTIVTFQDISRLKNVERDLKALLGTRDEFLSIASHELKTPITSLSMQIQMTQLSMGPDGERAPTPDRLRKMLRVATTQVGRLTSLVDDLLDVARIRTGQLTLRLESADLGVLVRETLERMAGHATGAECPIRIEAPPTLTGVWDARRLEQVLTNLVSNAVKYAPRKPIEIRLTAPGDTVSLEVRDFGPGVAEPLRETIFERFDRGGASRNAGGLGLGLFISRQLVQAHHGTISVDGPPGEGARFVVVLPRDASRAHSSRASAPAPTAST